MGTGKPCVSSGAQWVPRHWPSSIRTLPSAPASHRVCLAARGLGAPCWRAIPPVRNLTYPRRHSKFGTSDDCTVFANKCQYVGEGGCRVVHCLGTPLPQPRVLPHRSATSHSPTVTERDPCEPRGCPGTHVTWRGLLAVSVGSPAPDLSPPLTLLSPAAGRGERAGLPLPAVGKGPGVRSGPVTSSTAFRTSPRPQSGASRRTPNASRPLDGMTASPASRIAPVFLSPSPQLTSPPLRAILPLPGSNSPTVERPISGDWSFGFGTTQERI